MSEDNIAYIDQGDGYHIRLEIAEITDEFYKEKARIELNETPENTEVALIALRELLLGLFNYHTLFCYEEIKMSSLRCKSVNM